MNTSVKIGVSCTFVIALVITATILGIYFGCNKSLDLSNCGSQTSSSSSQVSESSQMSCTLPEWEGDLEVLKRTYINSLCKKSINTDTPYTFYCEDSIELKPVANKFCYTINYNDALEAICNTTITNYNCDDPDIVNKLETWMGCGS